MCSECEILEQSVLNGMSVSLLPLHLRGWEDCKSQGQRSTSRKLFPTHHRAGAHMNSQRLWQNVKTYTGSSQHRGEKVVAQSSTSNQKAFLNWQNLRTAGKLGLFVFLPMELHWVYYHTPGQAPSSGAVDQHKMNSTFFCGFCFCFLRKRIWSWMGREVGEDLGGVEGEERIQPKYIV